jgi:hypothetical protein
MVIIIQKLFIFASGKWAGSASTGDPTDDICMLNHTQVLSLQKPAVKAELGSQANPSTRFHLLLLFYFGLNYGRNPWSRPWTLKSKAMGVFNVCE